MKPSIWPILAVLGSACFGCSDSSERSTELSPITMDAGAFDGAVADGGSDAGMAEDAGATEDAGHSVRDGGQPMGGPEPLQAYSATVLLDGRLLIVGGTGTNTSQSESWLLDLNTLQFSAGRRWIRPGRVTVQPFFRTAES